MSKPVPSTATNAPSSDASSGFDAAWKSTRAEEDIQFSEIVPPKPPETPDWWKDFLSWLSEFLAPAGQAVADAWPVLRIILLVLLAAGVLTLLWVIVQPYIEEWRGRSARTREEEWQPEEGAARKLLEEADALAANGQYEEAAHLLLFRSIEDIERRRPDLLRASNTAREIERFESLPEKARAMFGVMSAQVERGIFAASHIGKEGWEASREAYGEFALAGNWKKSK